MLCLCLCLCLLCCGFRCCELNGLISHPYYSWFHFCLLSMADDIVLPLPWSRHVSKTTQQAYYFNKDTQQTQYEAPPGTIYLKNRPVEAAATGAPSLPPVSPAPSSVFAGPASPVTSAPVMKATTEAGKAVADAYTLQQLGSDKNARKQSRIYHLRNLQNWVKSTLISEYTGKGTQRVLDVACGKFGDLFKWSRLGVTHIVGVDISRKQVEDAIGRLNEYNASVIAEGRPGAAPINAKFVWADVGHVDLWRHAVLARDERFHAVSIQFALHYLFASEATAMTFFRNIADRLLPGGVFIATIPDANMLVRRLRDLPGEGDLEFGNSLFRIKFYPESKAKQWALGADPFGCKYNFFLKVMGDCV